MKVNISGVGLVPRVGLLAPVYGKDLTKDTISQIIRYQSFKVYVASSGAQITKSNIDEIFGNVSKTSETVSTPVSPEKKTSKKKVKESITEEKVEEKIYEPVVQETSSDVVSEPLPEITEDPETEEKFADIETVNEDSTVDSVEETPATETNPYRNNKKKKRH